MQTSSVHETAVGLRGLDCAPQSYLRQALTGTLVDEKAAALTLFIITVFLLKAY